MGRKLSLFEEILLLFFGIETKTAERVFRCEVVFGVLSPIFTKFDIVHVEHQITI